MTLRGKLLLVGWFLLFIAIMLLIMYVTTGCVGLVAPKAPYPYSYHQENKTCDYWIYHKHWQTKEAR
jgi:hypothetical protein